MTSNKGKTVVTYTLCYKVVGLEIHGYYKYKYLPDCKEEEVKKMANEFIDNMNKKTEEVGGPRYEIKKIILTTTILSIERFNIEDF